MDSSADLNKRILLNFLKGFGICLGTFALLAFLDVKKHRKNLFPLQYTPIQPSPPINYKRQDIVKDRFSSEKIPQDIDYIVIGSGISALTCSAFLSKIGKKILVLEQHDRTGGCMHQFSGKFHFDIGIHYIGNIRIYKKLLDLITDGSVEFIPQGDQENGYLYDEYIINFGQNNEKVIQAKANTRFIDLRNQYPDPIDQAAINKYEKYIADGNAVMYYCIVMKLLPYPIASMVNMIIRWKYKHIWNKTVQDIIDELFSHNKELGLNVTANIGDIGQFRKTTVFCIFAGLFDHYLKGGYYPRHGPQQIARELIKTIEHSGGRALANAKVTSIIFENNKAVGVNVFKHDGSEISIYSKSGIISSIGFCNTYTKLAPLDKIPAPLSFKYTAQRIIDQIPPSAQHFQIFIGMNKTSKELNLPSTNSWFIFVNESYDYDESLREYHQDPLKGKPLTFISFPSAKNPIDYEKVHPNQSIAVIIAETNYNLFDEWKDEPKGKRSKNYNDYKKQIGDRLIEEVFLKKWPQCRDCIVKIEYGTPLTAMHYIGSSHGESYGLSNPPERVYDLNISRCLAPKQPIHGLWLTGQDILSAGWAGAFHSGKITAEQILGYYNPIVLLSRKTLDHDLKNLK